VADLGEAGHEVDGPTVCEPVAVGRGVAGAVGTTVPPAQRAGRRAGRDGLIVLIGRVATDIRALLNRPNPRHVPELMAIEKGAIPRPVACTTHLRRFRPAPGAT